MTTALSALDVLPSNKREGELFAEMLKKEIPLQNSPLPILVKLKVLEKLIKDVLTNDDLDALYLLQFKEYAKDNKLEVSGVTLISQEFGAKYDYSQDAEWVQLDKSIKAWTEQKKKLEEILKSDKIKTPGKQKVVVKL